MAADQFIVIHATISQPHSTECFNRYSRTALQAWPKHHCVQQITFKTYVLIDRAIVERTREGGNKIQLSGGPTL